MPPIRHIAALTVGALLFAALLACADASEEPNKAPPALADKQGSTDADKAQWADADKPDLTDSDKSQWTDADKTDWADADKSQWADTDKSQWADDKDDGQISSGSVLEATVRLMEEAGVDVHYVALPGREERTVLATPREFVEGETPLVVSLHGFGGNSALQAMYVPLHERVNADGFALMLPNGTRDADGSRSWNPTDEAFSGKTGKTAQDDVAYLTELVSEAREIRNFGHIYFFGYSNGGFMAHHIGCKGLPGLRAVASLAGTSYVEESACDDAPAVSALQIHGSDDEAIRFDGDRAEPDAKSGGETAFYLGAREMAARWSAKAGCDRPAELEAYATLDLDEYVPGDETRAYRAVSGCADGVSVELWASEGSGHTPAYGQAFRDALIQWLLSQD